MSSLVPSVIQYHLTSLLISALLSHLFLLFSFFCFPFSSTCLISSLPYSVLLPHLLFLLLFSSHRSHLFFPISSSGTSLPSSIFFSYFFSNITTSFLSYHVLFSPFLLLLSSPLSSLDFLSFPSYVLPHSSLLSCHLIHFLISALISRVLLLLFSSFYSPFSSHFLSSLFISYPLSYSLFHLISKHFSFKT